jgi:hypothetical protein
MPQRKKHPSTRARRNVAPTAATLTVLAPPDYEDWSLAQLHAEVDRRNDGVHEDDHLPKPKTKPACVKLLLADDEALIPELPERPDMWHRIVQDWWRDVWTSPMSEEWHPETDFYNVLRAAMHFHDMWMAETPTQRQKASAEFDKILVPLGLTPYARRRLEWTMEMADDAKAKGRRRRLEGPPPVPAAQPVPGATDDPRNGFSVVS